MNCFRSSRGQTGQIDVNPYWVTGYVDLRCPAARKSLSDNDLRQITSANAVPKDFLKFWLDIADNYDII